MIDEDNRYNELTEHIRSVFDEHEEPGADAGWALLREKFPEEKDRRLAGWLWYAAAAVLLLFSGLWFLNKPDANQHNNNNVAHVKKMEPAKQNQGHDVIGTPAPVTIPPVDSIAPRNQNFNSSALMAGKPSGAYHQPASTQQAGQPANAFAGNQPTTKQADSATINHNAAAVNKIIQDVAKAQANSAVIAKNTIDSEQVNKQAQFVAGSPVKQQNNQKQQSSADAMNQLLANDAKQGNIKDRDKKNDKKALFGVYAATYFNYAKGSDNKMNVGAGLSSDFKLTKRLRLSTGVAIAQNSLNYNSNAPQDKIVATLSAAGAYSDVAMVSQGKSTPVPEAVNRNYSASLIGIDIPINLKFQFNPEKTDAYVAAGLSSGTFINETYTTNYSYGLSQQQSSSITKNFSGFDLAKTLNVSFGMGYPLGKSNRLIVEPFVKYPLDGLGSQQLKFGAGGVNLKLSFTGRK